MLRSAPAGAQPVFATRSAEQLGRNMVAWAAARRSFGGEPLGLAVVALDGRGTGTYERHCPGGAAFPEGLALEQWLGLAGALTGTHSPIWFARSNVQALTQPLSMEWIHLAASVSQAPSATQYSPSTPVDRAVRGRVVHSDLHVSGGPGTNTPGVPPDYRSPHGQPCGQRGGRGRRPAGGGGMQGGIVPAECAAHPLTRQSRR